MKRLVGTLLLVLLLVPLDALARGFGSGSSGSSARGRSFSSSFSARSNLGRSVLRPNSRSARRAAKQLEAFGERRRFEARVRMVNQTRDAQRRRVEARLLRDGRPGEVASYRRRIRSQDDLDDLSLRSTLRRLEARGRRADGLRGYRSLGPATSRAMLRNGLTLRRLHRDHERELRLNALEDALTREHRDTFAAVHDPFQRWGQP